MQDGCTALHAAVRSGHVDTLRLLLCHPMPSDATVTLDPGTLALPPALLNLANADGWTAAHTAAARGLKVTKGSSSVFMCATLTRRLLHQPLMSGHGINHHGDDLMGRPASLAPSTQRNGSGADLDRVCDWNRNEVHPLTSRTHTHTNTLSCQI